MKLLKVGNSSTMGNAADDSASIPPPTADQLDLAAAHLVFNYLAQHCYTESATAFLSQWLGEREKNGSSGEGSDSINAVSGPEARDLGSAGLQCAHRLSAQEGFAARSLEYRRQVQGLIIDGRIAEALQYLEEYFPNVLGGIARMEDGMEAMEEASGGGGEDAAAAAGTLRFELLCQQFVEMIRRGEFSEALEFTEVTLSPMAHNNPGLQAKLQVSEGAAGPSSNHIVGGTGQDVVVLLAYTQPAESPVKHLLSPRILEALAEKVNAAILGTSVSFCYPASCSHQHPEGGPAVREPRLYARVGRNESPLETIIKQMILVNSQLAGAGRTGKAAEFDDDALRVTCFLLEPMSE